MIKLNQIVPMEYSGKEDFALGDLKLYLEKRWRDKICKDLRRGYDEMSEINLSLAEIGFECDMEELYFYEVGLQGREIM